MVGFLTGFAITFGVVFLAELGDKSQLMTLTLATRHRAFPVLVGTTLAAAVVHAISVSVGVAVGAVLPTAWIRLVAAVAFLAFGAWTLRGEQGNPAEEATRSTRSVVVTVFTAFVLAELGDKTMLATLTLAAQYGWIGTWLGSTVGTVAANGLAILVGRRLRTRLPQRAIAVVAAVLFLVLGSWLLVDATGELTGRPVSELLAGWIASGSAVPVAVGAGTVLALVCRAGRRRWPLLVAAARRRTRWAPERAPAPAVRPVANGDE